MHARSPVSHPHHLAKLGVPGVIDPEVATYWRDNYDLKWILQRDWARLGRLIAQRGEMEGRRIVSKAWINEITSWGEKGGQVRHGTPPLPGGSALNDLSE